MSTKKRKALSTEAAFLLEVAGSGDNGIRYERSIHRSLAVSLLQAGLIEPVKPKQYAERLYATRAGKKAAELIRETDHAE